MASISKRHTQNGVKWRVQIRRPGLKPIHRTAATKGEAQALARAIERELDLGKSVAARDMTINQLVSRYIDDAGGEEALTKSKATSFRHIRRLLGEMRIKDLGNREILEFARKRRRLDPGKPLSVNGTKQPLPLSPATIAMDIGYLSDLLDYGTRNYNTPVRIAEVKLARIDMRKEKLVAKSREVNRLPTDDEFDQMIAAATADQALRMPLSTILRIARSTGMRESELCKIRWSDLNAGSRVLNVPLRKHPRGPRDKEMPLIPNHGIDPLMEILSLRNDPLCLRHKEYRRNKGETVDLDDLILPFGPGSIGAAFRRLRQRLGLRPIRLHDLRHDAATALAKREGLHFREAMVVLGHDDVKSIARYTHFTAAEIAQRHAGGPPTR